MHDVRNDPGRLEAVEDKLDADGGDEEAGHVGPGRPIRLPRKCVIWAFWRGRRYVASFWHENTSERWADSSTGLRDIRRSPTPFWGVSSVTEGAILPRRDTWVPHCHHRAVVKAGRRPPVGLGLDEHCQDCRGGTMEYGPRSEGPDCSYHGRGEDMSTPQNTGCYKGFYLRDSKITVPGGFLARARLRYGCAR